MSDPVREAEAWIRRQDRKEREYLARCPVCERCREPITDDWVYRIDDNYYHEDCLLEECRVRRF